MVKILSKQRSYEFEPQGSAMVGTIKPQEHRKDIWDRIKDLKGKVLNVLGITEYADVIVVLNEKGRDPLVFDLKEEEVHLFVPVKNMEGLFIPINMKKEAELYYVGCASTNGTHNSEIIDLIIRYEQNNISYDMFYNSVTKKYI